MEQQQGVASGNATLQALLQGLNLGFQGSNTLQGQQAIFDPSALANSGAQAGQTVFKLRVDLVSSCSAELSALLALLLAGGLAEASNISHG